MAWRNIAWVGWAKSLRDTLRSSFWFLPTVMALGAVAAAEGLVALDHRVPAEWIERLPWVFAATADGTRATVSVVAGSMITVTGVVFSITIVALTLASSQFGPRLLRSFMRDRVNQLVLGVFVATFLYSLLVLRSIQADDGGTFVPHIAAGGSVLLGAASLFVLILFIHHVASSIQASSVIASVACEIEVGIPHLFPERIGEPEPEAPTAALLERIQGESVSVRSAGSGYVRVIDGDRLLELATQNELCIAIERRPGDFAASGSILARVVGAGDGVSETLEACIREAFVLGDHRTPLQDLLFPVGQLAEMASRALSPGINDSRTAISCVHRLGDAIAAVAERPDPVPCRRDDSGDVRILASVTRFADVLAAGFDPIRLHGAANPAVVVSLFEALGEAASRCSTDERRETIRDCAEALDTAARASIASKRDLEQVERSRAALDSALARRAAGADSADT